ncbi:MAG: phage portal protein, partial [Proteobacteria bacterium]
MESDHNAKIYTLKTGVHESARVDGYADGWTANRVSARGETESARDIEARARDLVRNSSIARTIIDVQVNAITQPTPALVLQPISRSDESEKRAKVANDYIYDAFESTGIDYERMRSPSEFFSAVVEEAAIGGGTLGVRIWDKKAKLGFRVKMFEQSYLARDLTKKTGAGGWIIEGKEYDSADRLIAYHIYDTYADDP